MLIDIFPEHSDWIDQILEASTCNSMGKNINAIFNIQQTSKVYNILGAHNSCKLKL